MAVTNINAQNILLPAPVTDGGLPVNQALAGRHSTREFDKSRRISIQLVSDLLWASCGVNRPEENLRTNPTGRNCQEIDAYWFDIDGVYFYDFSNNVLVEVARGDYRGLIAGTETFSQDFVLDAPGCVLFVIDTARLPQGDAAMKMAYMDACIASENLNIFCAGNGLATVPRMSMDTDGIRKILKLSDSVVPAINNPVGYAQ